MDSTSGKGSRLCGSLGHAYVAWVFLLMLLSSLVGRKGISTQHSETLVVSEMPLHMSRITVCDVTIYTPLQRQSSRHLVIMSAITELMAVVCIASFDVFCSFKEALRFFHQAIDVFIFLFYGP